MTLNQETSPSRNVESNIDITLITLKNILDPLKREILNIQQTTNKEKNEIILKINTVERGVVEIHLSQEEFNNLNDFINKLPAEFLWEKFFSGVSLEERVSKLLQLQEFASDLEENRGFQHDWIYDGNGALRQGVVDFYTFFDSVTKNGGDGKKLIERLKNELAKGRTDVDPYEHIMNLSTSFNILLRMKKGDFDNENYKFSEALKDYEITLENVGKFYRLLGLNIGDKKIGLDEEVIKVLKGHGIKTLEDLINPKNIERMKNGEFGLSEEHIRNIFGKGVGLIKREMRLTDSQTKKSSHF